MGHLTEGALRRSVDEPFAISDRDRAHLAGCARCRGEQEAARDDRELVGAALSGPDEPRHTAAGPDAAAAAAAVRRAEVERAWAGLQARVAAQPPSPPRTASETVQPLRLHRRPRLRHPAVAVGVAALVVVGTTAAAAAENWLPIFHPATVAPVSFQFQELAKLPDLSAYGTLTGPRGWQPTPVADAATAAARTGIDLPAISAQPTGVTGAPQYAVLPAGTARFTFSAAKARATAAAHGQTLPPMPAGVDGSSLRLDAGAGVVESWKQAGSVPVLTVVRMAAPTLSSEGVSLSTLEGYLLAQPGIPADVAAQLRALPVNGSVLPIPVPSDQATSTRTTVDGVPATLVRLRDQSAGALIWIRDGRLNAVVGLLSTSDLQKVARELG
jgi:hypothetical protein